MKKLISLLFLISTLILNSQTGVNKPGWLLNGNAGVTGNFLGTTNSLSLVFKTNNIQRAFLDLSGNFIVGTNTVTNFDIDVVKNKAASLVAINAQNTSTTGYTGIQTTNADNVGFASLITFNNGGGVGTFYDNGTSGLSTNTNGYSFIINENAAGGWIFTSNGYGGSNERLRISKTNGNIGLSGSSTSKAGGGTPTAFLHLSPGNTTYPPLRFTSGPLTTGTNVIAGGIEFLTDKFYGIITTGAARKTFMFMEGTATNDNAIAGNIGESVTAIKAVGSATAMVTATAVNVLTISLTAGDWDVEANLNFNETSSTVSSRKASIVTTSSTQATDGSECYNGIQSTVTSEINTITLPNKRISISSTTTIYLVGTAVFSAGTCAAFGTLTARRIR